MINLQVYIICLGVLVLTTTTLAYRSFFESHRPGSRTFGFLMLSMSVWTFFYLFEIILPHFSQKIIARKILYLGMTLSAPFWLGFALRYTVYSKWWSQYARNALLTIPGVLAFLLGATNEYHHLIWWSLAMPVEGTLGPLRLSYGRGFWVHSAIAYAMIVLGCVIYLNVYFRSPRDFRKQTGVILLGVFVTLLSNVISLMGVFPSVIDPTPLSFALSAPLFAIGFFRFGLFNLSPIASPMIIENLHDAVIVVDDQNRVSKINLAAKKWFNLDDHAFGAFVFDILPKPDLFRDKWDVDGANIKFKIEQNEKHATYDTAITHLHKSDGSLLGRVIIIHDVTQEQELLEAEFHHSIQLGLLEEIGRNITDSLNEQEILERSLSAMTDYFGFAEVAISLLTDDNHLEMAAVSGTQDFGYKPKYKQEMGKGIIGRVAEIRRTYLTQDVSKDPYYFSSAERRGSAIGIPMLNEKDLLGVLYVESAKIDAFTEDDVQTLETLAKNISAAVQRARLYENAQEHLQVMSAVQSISQVVSSSLELDKIYQSVLEVLRSSFGFTHISIYLLQGDYLQLGAQSGYENESALSKLPIAQGINGRTVQTKQTQFVADVANDPNFVRFSEEVGSEICVPLLKEDEILGTINVEGKIDSPLTQADADMLTILAGPIALAVDNARLHAQVKIASITDLVSGLYNRRFFEDTLQIQIERAARSGNPLSLIIFDVDSFKDYNDTWGHPAGDARLKATADLIIKNLRKYDIAARYGGDEFAIILPDTDHKGAMLFAKRLLTKAQNSAPDKSAARKQRISGYTLSIGVATLPQHGDTAAALLLSADHAELIAKRMGKNRILSANELNYEQITPLPPLRKNRKKQVDHRRA
jgi:diguanylate cyclase (GGDEF)-like protein